MDDLFQDIDQVLGKEELGKKKARMPEAEALEDWPDDASGYADSREGAQADLDYWDGDRHPSPNSPPQDLVHRATNANSPSSSHPAKSSSQPVSPASFPLVARPASISEQPINSAMGSGNSLELGFQGVFVPASPLPSEPTRSAFHVYERILLGVGCVSVVVALAFWALRQDAHRARPSVSTGSVPMATNPSVGSTSQFADYVQKALESIDQRSAQGNTAQTQSGQMPGLSLNQGLGADPNLPNGRLPNSPLSNPSSPADPHWSTVPIPKAISPVGRGRLSTGLERIYVPIYQPPQTLPGTAIAPLPNLKSPFSSNKPSPSMDKGAQGSRAQTAAQFSGKNSQNTATLPPAIVSSEVVRRLAGVLSQGDRSAALFEISGVTQRYEIGESIGSSGWTLVEVSKDQAIIRRNGEVRSLFVGHSF
jgi:hypothetical protein